MKKVTLNLFSKIFNLIARKKPRNFTFYNLFKPYFDNYNGENNSNINTNGEIMVMQRFLAKYSVVFDIGNILVDGQKLL